MAFETTHILLVTVEVVQSGKVNRIQDKPRGKVMTVSETRAYDEFGCGKGAITRVFNHTKFTPGNLPRGLI